MIAFCANCSHENEIEVVHVNRAAGTFDFEYECEYCGYSATEESDLDV